MTKKTWFTILLIWIIFTILTAWAVDREHATKPEATPVVNYLPTPEFGKIRAGIIRLGPGCPCLHDTGDHAAVGITKVWVDANGNLNVDTDFDHSEYLVTAHADPDATMVPKRVNCGVSGGGTHSVVVCARQDTGTRIRANSSYYDPNRDNIWFWTWAVPR